MGRSSKKQLSELEKLHTENRELREINKALAHKLKEELKKNKTPSEPLDLPIKVNLKKKDNDCKNCGEGKIVHTDIGPRVIITCSKTCGYRKVIKNVKEEKKDSQDNQEEKEKI